MESLTQLKKIREDAIDRLRECDDYKLIGKLGDLITELGGTLSPLPAGVVVDNVSIEQAFRSDAKPSTSATSFQTRTGASTVSDNEDKSSEIGSKRDDVEAAEDLVDEMVAELKSENLGDDETEISSPDDKDETVPAVSIFRNRSDQATNGAAKSF